MIFYQIWWFSSICHPHALVIFRQQKIESQNQIVRLSNKAVQCLIQGISHWSVRKCIFEVKEAVVVIEVIMADGANEAIEVIRFTQELEFNNLMARIILFWCFENRNFLGRNMEFQIQFWHPSDLRLWRTDSVIYVKIDWRKSNAHCYWTCLYRKISPLSLRPNYFQTFQCKTPCSNRILCTSRRFVSKMALVESD